MYLEKIIFVFSLSTINYKVGQKWLNFPYFRTPFANFLLSRPNSVEYGNFKTTTLLPSAKCTRPLFQGRTACGGRPSGWHDIVTCQHLVVGLESRPHWYNVSCLFSVTGDSLLRSSQLLVEMMQRSGDDESISDQWQDETRRGWHIAQYYSLCTVQPGSSAVSRGHRYGA